MAETGSRSGDHCTHSRTPIVLTREKLALRTPRLVPVAGLRCDACGEILYTPEQADRARQAAYAEIRLRENLLLPAEITAIRQTLGLKQEEFERLLGVGPKTVVRWEAGRVFQSKAADSLMRLVRADRGNAERLGQWNDVEVNRAPALGRRVRKAS